MHADDFREDRYGVVSGLRDGGYSDDMTLAAIAGNSFFARSYGSFVTKKTKSSIKDGNEIQSGN